MGALKQRKINAFDNDSNNYKISKKYERKRRRGY
jgi:hypothetical protein